MKVLSLYWGICSTASLFIDGKIAAAVSEERFTRKKNDDSFPRTSLRWCLEKCGLKASELDAVAIASYEHGYDAMILRKTSSYTIEDYVREQKFYWYPKLYEGKNPDPLDVFKHLIDTKQYPSEYFERSLKDKTLRGSFDRDTEDIVAGFLGITKNKVRRIEHHRCHAAYGYYASPFRNEPVLAITVDGWGDGNNATINVVHPDGSFERVYETSQCNIGRIYRYITLLLGMKPNEHEYKVMGLAPYGKEKIAQKSYDVFKETLYVDDIDFKWNIKPTDSYYWFKERLEGCRFDGIAAGLQRWVEELLCAWVGNAVEKFGIDTVIMSGGVAMNVKAMGRVAMLPQVKKFFVGGTSSDESMALSSGICLAQDLTVEAGREWRSQEVRSFGHLFYGPSASYEDENRLAERVKAEGRFIVHEKPSYKRIAELLAKGMIIARCAGRMEFGQRSLGNRSILADPIDVGVVSRINRMIKNRDFWMPFAPVVIDAYAVRYLVNPKGIESPHMTVGYDTTDEGWRAMPAGCHPADRTARAQILKMEANPVLYSIIEEFAVLTGRGALLNTSFNLHGYPIVNTIEEAYEIFASTELDGMLMADHLILKEDRR
jgi:carbamoyltransferase